MASLKIAIIGAGPGGCMLARLLQVADPSISTTIFESELSVDYRSQGGTLDLRTDTGLAAIKAAQLWDEFQKCARYDGESLLVTDKSLVTWMRRRPRKDAQDNKTKRLGEAPEIDRKELRRMLLECLPAEAVRWGYKLLGVEEEETAGSSLRLRFANGEVLTGFDLIVGCDGAFSKTRRLLTSETPFYVGIAGWTLSIPDAAKTAPEEHAFVNGGSVFAYSDLQAFFLQQLGDGSLHLAFYGPFPHHYPDTCGYDVTHLEEARKAIRERMRGWKPAFVNAVDKARGSVQWRNLYQLPVGFDWPHKAGVTLLGDAAHLMTPFAGIGVNTAFYDAMLLSGQIRAFVQQQEQQQQQQQHGKTERRSLDEHIKAYEQEMLASAHKSMQLTQDTMHDIMCQPGAPRTSIERWILRHAKTDLPRWTHPLLTVVVYIGYWIYKWFV